MEDGTKMLNFDKIKQIYRFSVRETNLSWPQTPRKFFFFLNVHEIKF